MALSPNKLENDIQPLILKFLRGRDAVNLDAKEIDSKDARDALDKQENDYIHLSRELSKDFAKIITEYIKSGEVKRDTSELLREVNRLF